MTHTHDTRTDSDLLDSMEQVLEDSPARQSRRALMAKAGGLVAAGTALAVPGVAQAAPASRNSIASVLATFEAFGVTLLTEAVKRAPGTPSAQFAGVVQAANTTEFVHYQALRDRGARPLTTRFWIPAAVLDGGAALFNAVALQEEVEISAYLVGVTEATRKRDAKGARLYAEALGTEAEHRVLARFARDTIVGSKEVPNNRGFEAFKQKSAASALRATEALGVGFGKKSNAPGAFFTFPGDPRKNGTGSPVATPRPS
jgi:ferritin-like metal-binding protein YciE